MKKLIFVILLCETLTIVLTGCVKTQNDFIGGESIIEIATTGDVTLSIKENTLTNTGAIILLKNNSEKIYFYGNPYLLEIKQHGKWYSINVKLYFTMPAFSIIPGETKEFEVNWENSYGKLAKGTYRIIKGIDYEKEDGNYERFNVAVEFTI